MTYSLTPDPSDSPRELVPAPPPIIPAAFRGPAPAAAEQFRAPRARRTWTVGLIGAIGLLELASMIPMLLLLALITQINAGQYVSEDTGTAIDLAAGAIGLVQFALLLAAAVVFCCWFYRINANARMLTDEPAPASPGFAVGSIFIPFVNLVVPCRAALFSWRASARAAYPYIDDKVPGASPVGVWWATWLISNIIGHISARMSMSAMFADEDPTLEEIANLQYLGLAAAAAGLLAAATCVYLVIKLTAMQQRVATGMREPQ